MTEEVPNIDIPQTLLQNRKLFLMKPIDAELANEIIGSLIILNEVSDEEPIHLFINSGGGEVDSGLAIYDVIRSIYAPVYTYCVGSCYSMAAVLLAAGDRRAAFQHSEVMIHQPSGGVSGKSVEIGVYSKNINKTKKTLIKILAKHTKQPIEKITKDVENDFWMSANEAKKYGLIDTVIRNINKGFEE